MGRRMLSYITVLLAAFMCADSHAQQKKWTLEDCIAYALEHNTGIRRQALSVEGEEISLSEARWSYAPSFSASGGYSISTGRVLDQTTYSFIENETVGSSSASLSGSIDIFRGFRKHRELQRARLNLKAGAENLEAARKDLRMEVTSCYLQVLCAGAAVSEAEQIASMLETQTEKVRVRVEAGKVTEADLLQVRAKLYAARNDVLSAGADYDLARFDLCQLLEIDDFRNFEPDMPETAESPAMLPGDIGSHEESVSGSPEVKSAQIAVEIARKNLQIARSSYWPGISLSAGYGSSHSGARQKALQNPDGTFRYEAYPFFRQYADNASSYVSLSISIPIFSGLSTRKGVKRAQLAVTDAEYALTETRKGVAKELFRAETEARTAQEKYMAAKEEAGYAEEAARQITVKYENGAADMLAYTTAISEFASARYRLVASKYECIFKLRLLEVLY